MCKKGRKFLSPDGALVDGWKTWAKKLLMRDNLVFDKGSGSGLCLRTPDCFDLTNSWRKEARHATIKAESEGISIS